MSDASGFSWLEQYPQGVRPTLEYPEQPLHSFLEQAAARFPEREAIIFFGKKLTYQELRQSTIRFAAALAALGIGKGDRIALMLPNCPQFIIAYFGILRLGAIVVPINPLNAGRELEEQLKHASCKLLIYLDTQQRKVAAACDKAGLDACIVTGLQEYMPPLQAFFYRRSQRRKGKQLTPVAGPGLYHFGDLLLGNHPAPPEAVINPREDLAVLQYTGGTTGTAKAAMLSHFNLTANTLQNREWFHDCEEGKEVIMGVLPFTHIYGMTGVMNLSVLLAATVVVFPRFTALDTMQAIERWRATVFPGVPAMFSGINSILGRFPGRFNLSSLRFCISGAAALPVETANTFREKAGVILVEGYGLSEASPVTHCNLLSGTPRAGSVGLPLPDTDCRIMDLEHGLREMPVGVAGELIIRGPQVMQGYWNMPGETETALRDGWLYTGDIARLDKQGYTYIVDRKKDLIIDSGYNIYPEEIESVLRELPQVADVAVVGLPDRVRGERIKAYIVLKEGEDLSSEDVIAHCRDKLAAYKIPRLVEFRRYLPKTMVGKTLRRMLLEEERNKPHF